MAHLLVAPKRRSELISAVMSVDEAVWHLTADAREQFFRDGYCVVDPCLSAEQLNALKEECAALSQGVDLDTTDCVVDLWAPQALPDNHRARIDAAEYQRLRASIVADTVATAAGSDVGRRSRTGSQLVVQTLFGQLASLASDAFSALLRHPCGSARVPDTRLFNEHYVVKPAHSAIEFGWHTDENEQLMMTLDKPSMPYLSLWCPLCNADEDNGTLEILPRSTQPQPPAGCDKNHPFFNTVVPEGRSGGEAIQNKRAPVSCQPEAAIAVSPPQQQMQPARVRSARIRVGAGGVVLFASDVWHRSGKNRSAAARQVFYAQYSCGLLRSDGSLGACLRPGDGQGGVESCMVDGQGVAGRGGEEALPTHRAPKGARLAGPLCFGVAVPACAVPTKQGHGRDIGKEQTKT